VVVWLQFNNFKAVKRCLPTVPSVNFTVVCSATPWLPCELDQATQLIGASDNAVLLLSPLPRNTLSSSILPASSPHFAGTRTGHPPGPSQQHAPAREG
jgi:hypothetical protein